MAAAPAASHTLLPDSEFRFEVDASATVELTLVSGSAEVFGAEMVANRAYAFSGTQQAVFSWTGCTLEVQGACGHSYVAAETPMQHYLQLHGELDARRVTALAAAGEGPRVLVAGPADTGKSSLSRLLANYLARSGHAGTLIDLDLEQGDLLVPGAIAAVPIARPLEIERGTEDLAPLAYWLGHASVQEHAPVLRLLCASLARAVRQRHEADGAARAGGLVVNSCGWVDGAGYELLLYQAAELQCDVIVVIGDDRLHSQLTAHAAQSPHPPTVVKLGKSGGVITRSAASRAEARASRVREYFYGPRRELSPFTSVLDFGALNVLSIAPAPQAPTTALPIGMKLPENQMIASQLPPARYPSLVHSVLAVVYAPSGTCDDLLGAPAAGFVWVSAVDMERQKVTLLAPSPVALPSSWLLSGTLKWAHEA